MPVLSFVEIKVRHGKNHKVITIKYSIHTELQASISIKQQRLAYPY